MELYSKKIIKDIRNRHGFNFSKSLGQNFITDGNIIREIIEGSQIGPDDLVIEIGPGIGVLTAAAAEYGSKVIAVEIDSRLIPILEETLAGYDNVEIINKDILKTDLNDIIRNEKEKGAFCGAVRIIGNLPYYITTPIIMGILEKGVAAESITIMMQKEVAERIKGDPGTKIYGALSIAVQYYCTIEEVVTVPKEVFVPMPKVDSSILQLTLRKSRPVELIDERVFFACVKNGFAQRRKTLLNSLTGVEELSKEDIKEVLEAENIDSRRRAETLNIDEFAAIANNIAEKKLRGRKLYGEDKEIL